LEVDINLTQNEYAIIKNSSAEICGCENCLNYLDIRDSIFPDEVKELFSSLGIDGNKEIEISHLGELENGFHYYSGWFHYIGRFYGKDCTTELPEGGSTVDYLEITKEFGIGFTKMIALSVFESDEDLVQIEFNCKIPWANEK